MINCSRPGEQWKICTQGFFNLGTKSDGGGTNRVRTQSPLVSCKSVKWVPLFGIGFFSLFHIHSPLAICQKLIALMARTGICSAHSTTVAFVWFTSAVLFFFLFQMALHNSGSGSGSVSSSGILLIPRVSLENSVYFPKKLGFILEDEW